MTFVEGPAVRPLELILYQSPGVEQELLKKMADKGHACPKTTLYVAEWDKVPDFGFGHLCNPTVVIGSFKGLTRSSVLASHRGFFHQDPPKGSGIPKADALKKVTYEVYSPQRKLGGDLSGLADRTGVAGTWTSNWGPVSLSHPVVERAKPVPITGSFAQPNAGTGTIKSGSWDPATGTLVFEYYQPWNKAEGKATLTLSKDGKTLSGGYKQTNGSGSWTMTRP